MLDGDEKAVQSCHIRCTYTLGKRYVAILNQWTLFAYRCVVSNAWCMLWLNACWIKRSELLCSCWLATLKAHFIIYTVQKQKPLQVDHSLNCLIALGSIRHRCSNRWESVAVDAQVVRAPLWSCKSPLWSIWPPISPSWNYSETSNYCEKTLPIPALSSLSFNSRKDRAQPWWADSRPEWTLKVSRSMVCSIWRVLTLF